MTISNYKSAVVLCGLLALLAAVPAHAKSPAPAQDSADVLADDVDDDGTAPPTPELKPALTPAADEAAEPAPKAAEAPVKDTKDTTTKAQESAAGPAAAKPAEVDVKPQKAALGSLTMREPTPQLNQIALWRDDADKAAPNDVWDGTDALDVPTILPALVMAKNPRIKQITLRIAMSAVYSPAGMTDMDYIRWRGDVLMAQKQPALAARLLSTARLGRDSREDVQRRTAYELAAGETEAACVESMASGGDSTHAFWQGMAILCAQHLGDQAAAKTLIDHLPDGAIKTAANSGKPDDLTDATLKASGALPVAKAIPDNHDILVKLQALLDAIDDADDSKLEAQKNKGQLLLLSLGALRAEKRGADTQKLTDKALALAGF